MDYKDILYNYAEYFEQSDVASNVIRWIGWQIIKLLHGICDMCQGLWEAVFQALDFTKTFADKLGVYYPIWSAIFLITILAVGTVFLYSEHRPPFLKNLVITMAVVMLLPSGVRLSAQLLQIEQTVFMANGNSVADTTVITNVTDLLYQKNNDWSFESPNCFSGATIKYIDPNEQVEKKTAKVFKYYMVVDEASGEVTYKKIGKGFFGLLTPLYYRYSIHFMAIIGELIVNSLVLIFASYRLFRLIWDMIYGEILAYILSGDVVSGEKTKQVLQYLLNLFWSISIMIWGFAIWREFEIWVASQYTNNFIRIIMIAFGGVAMIDGSDVVERVMGIDVGVKDGMMKTMGAMHLMQSGIGAAKAGAGAAKKAAGVAKKAGESMLNPGGQAQQSRMQETAGTNGRSQQAQEPPGGAGNPGGQGSEDNARREPPGGAQTSQQQMSNPSEQVENRQGAANGQSGTDFSAGSGTENGEKQADPSAANTDEKLANAAGVSTNTAGAGDSTQSMPEMPTSQSESAQGAGKESSSGDQSQNGNAQNSNARNGHANEAAGSKTGNEPPGKASTPSDKQATAEGTQKTTGENSKSESAAQKKTESAGKTEQRGKEPPGGASKSGKRGEGNAEVGSQDDQMRQAGENDQPSVSSESADGSNEPSAMSEGIDGGNEPSVTSEETGMNRESSVASADANEELSSTSLGAEENPNSVATDIESRLSGKSGSGYKDMPGKSSERVRNGHTQNTRTGKKNTQDHKMLNPETQEAPFNGKSSSNALKRTAGQKAKTISQSKKSSSSRGQKSFNQPLLPDSEKRVRNGHTQISEPPKENKQK